MSFDKLNKQELSVAAEFFGVDIDPNDPKALIAQAFVDNGVTWDQYKKFLDPEVPVVAPVVAELPPVTPETGILMIMQRENRSMNIKRYTFTKENPFCVVTPEDADYIMARYEGFRPALPSEAKKYYG